MQSRIESPYKKCPIYETKQFVFRKVQEQDAEDLLACYSDLDSAEFFNSDNCTSNFIYKSIDEMKDCIKDWINEYDNQGFVRFSIIDKQSNKAIGTIEIFAKEKTIENYGKVGVLRIDLASKYETEDKIVEILNMVEDNLYDCFEFESIVIKAIPKADQRIIALKNIGYKELNNNNAVVSFSDYHIKVKKDLS